MVLRQNVASAPGAGQRRWIPSDHERNLGHRPCIRVEGLERFMRTQAMAMAEVLGIEPEAAVVCLKNLVESERSGLDPAKQR